MEQEESSHPSRSGRERAVKQNPTQDGFIERIREEERRPLHRDPALRGKSVAGTLSEETHLGTLMSRPYWMWDLFVPLL